MKILFSIKYKILTLFILLIASISYVFFNQTVGIFEEDKKAYIYSAALSLVEGDEKNLEAEITTLEHHTRFLLNLKLNGEIFNESLLNQGQFICSITPDQNKNENHLELANDRITLIVQKDNFTCKKQSSFLTNIDKNPKNGFLLAYYHPQGSKPETLKNTFHDLVAKNNYTTGVTEIKISNESYIAAYIKTFSGVYLIRFINKNKAYEALGYYKNKILLMGIMFLSFAGIISLIFSIKLTNPIISLRDKMILFANNGTDSDISYQVVTNDEIGIIGHEFNSMVKKIKALLDNLKVYNTQLEAVIKKRTKELRKATALQSAMINSLNQGFFMVDEKYKIQDIFSKSMEDLLGKDFNKKKITSLLSSDSFNEDAANLFLENVFKESIPFESLRGLAPARIYKNNKVLDLSVEVIRRKDETILFILFILNDVTEKLELEKQIDLEKMNANTVLKIMTNQISFQSTIQEVAKLFVYIEDKKDIERTELYRFAHTVKGAVLMYDIKELARIIHNIEDEIKSANPESIFDLKNKLCISVDDYFCHFFAKYPFLIGAQSWRNLVPFKAVNMNSLRAFVKVLEQSSPELNAQYRDMFINQPLEEIYGSLVEDIKNVATKLHKNVQVVIKNAQEKIDPNLIDPHIPYLIHLTRNSIDHGIESAEERIQENKSPHGEIQIATSLSNNELTISIKDNGRGINQKRLIEKAKEKGSEVEKPSNPLDLIFESDISTKDEISEFSGRGIGLGAVKNYFQSLNGSISVESSHNIGTEFIIRIPV